MAAISIPSAGKTVLENISELSDADFNRLKAALELLPNYLNNDVIEAHLNEQVGDIGVKLSELVAHLLGMERARFSGKMTAQEFADSVLNDYRSGNNAAPDNLSGRIVDLLGIRPVIFLARELDLRRESERLYCEARVLSDIRPIFDDDCATPIGAIIMHNLRIRYHDDSVSKEFFVSLDSDDLAKLKAVIERAETKERVLSEFVSKTGIMNAKMGGSGDA